MLDAPARSYIGNDYPRCKNLESIREHDRDLKALKK